ncbi:NAD(+) diphosphatase [Pokkaliibacter sp. CJK22405]|uniref:NAD(+) diphosphatase n=1 Tax=Pokkaliibacter sp. CJK22405 TaxID=3384615 RepID=UPI0039853F9E
MNFDIVPVNGEPGGNDQLLLMYDGQVWVTSAGQWLLSWDRLAEIVSDSVFHPVGEMTLDSGDRFKLWTAEVEHLDSYTLVGLRAALLDAGADNFVVLARAAELNTWWRDHRFCGRCGHKTEPLQGEVAQVCPACHHRAYPRLSPCIIVLVRQGERALLAKAPHFPAGRYSTLAGFIEAGETAEQAVHREVFEETAIRVKNVRYVSSQSWPFPHSLMLGFEAEYESGDILCQPGEIEDARWWSADELPDMPPSVSIARELIDRWLAQVSR